MDDTNQLGRQAQSQTEIVHAPEILPTGQELGIALRDPKLLAQFLDEPLLTIAEAITGALAMGRAEVALVAGRLVQGALKGKLFKQFAREIKGLIETGRIKEDYANTKYGFKSLVELLEFIDSEVPDEDRLKAVKAMFIALNSVDAKEGEEILNYHCLLISKKLSSSELAVLVVCFRFHSEAAPLSTNSAREWAEIVARKVGHGVSGVVEHDEMALISNNLMTERIYPDKSGIVKNNWRLTDLGLRFCEYLRRYGDFLT